MTQTIEALRLGVPSHGDIHDEKTFDPAWAELWTVGGKPAEWALTWKEFVVDSDGDTTVVTHDELGLFPELRQRIHYVLNHPMRDKDSDHIRIELNGWAIRHGHRYNEATQKRRVA